MKGRFLHTGRTLTLIAVPLLYYEFFREKVCPLRAEETELKEEEKEREKNEN